MEKLKVRVLNRLPLPIRRAGQAWPAGEWVEAEVDTDALKRLQADPGLTVETLSTAKKPVKEVPSQ